MTAPANENQVKSGRGRKPGTVAKVRPPIPTEEFVVVKPNEETRATYKRAREERSAQQQQVDKLVFDSYKEWVEAGMPTNWVDMPVTVWPVSPQHEENALFMIRKACTFFGRKPYFGNIKKNAKTGKVEIPFCIIARPKRNRRRDDDED